MNSWSEIGSKPVPTLLIDLIWAAFSRSNLPCWTSSSCWCFTNLVAARSFSTSSSRRYLSLFSLHFDFCSWSSRLSVANWPHFARKRCTVSSTSLSLSRSSAISGSDTCTSIDLSVMCLGFGTFAWSAPGESGILGRRIAPCFNSSSSSVWCSSKFSGGGDGGGCSGGGAGSSTGGGSDTPEDLPRSLPLPTDAVLPTVRLSVCVPSVRSLLWFCVVYSWNVSALCGAVVEVPPLLLVVAPLFLKVEFGVP